MSGEAALFFELRNGLVKSAFPVFVDGTRLKTKSGYVEDVDRRAGTSQANRALRISRQGNRQPFWSHFLGYGLTRPIDDMGPHNPSSHPELLESLAGEFTSKSYNLKSLIRWIILSEPYGLSSQIIARNKNDDSGARRKAAVHSILHAADAAEELYQSLVVATEADKSQRPEAQEAKAANGSSSSRSRWATTRGKKPRPSTAPFRRR